MRKIHWFNNIFYLCAIIVPAIGSAQEKWAESEPYYVYDTLGYGEFDQEIPIDYHFNRPYSYSEMRKDDPFYDSPYFGRKYDNSENFTSGISSYQGTSTGPGPNGGYPGTPRGVYQTNYIDRSIYPNSYMEIYPR